MTRKLLNTISVSYSERHRYFDFDDEKKTYKIKQWCKDLNLHPFLFSDAFFPHLMPKERYSTWVGGNSSAKSTNKARIFVKRALGKKHFRLLFLRHHHSDNKSTTYLALKGIIQKEGLEDRFQCLDHSMNFLCTDNGNLMISGGLDKTGKFSGLEDFTDIWFEEPITRSNGKIDMITHEQYEDLDSRLRMPNAKLTLHTTLNPISKQFFMYSGIFDPELEKKPEKRLYSLNEIDYCHTTYKDNPFLPQEAITVIERFKGSRVEWGQKGLWANEKTGIEWVDKFDKDIHVKCVYYLTDRETHLTFDFNILPYPTCLCIQLLRLTNGVLQIRVFREYCLRPPLNSPENACKFFIQDYLEQCGYNNVSFYGDASGRYGYDGFRGIEDELKRYLHNDSDRVIKKNPAVRGARDFLNEILEGTHKDLEIVIDEECVELIEDLETLQTAPDGFDPKRVNGVEQRGHCYSALIYFLAEQFPEKLKENKGK